MKDNFDLKKFLTENKVAESSNPYLKTSLKEDTLRAKIREMIMNEIADFADEETLAMDDEFGPTFADIEPDLYEAKDDEADEEDVEADPDMQEEPEGGEGDVDITDEEGGEEMDMEGDATGGADLEGTEGEILKHLMASFNGAKETGDEKLVNQIGNTIKFLVKTATEYEA